MQDCNKTETNNTKQAAWVAIGSLFSFSFGIISSMILSRYFSKGDYGTYKQVFYVYETLLVVFTLGLPRTYSFFLPRVEVSEAKRLIQKITNLFFVLGALFSVLLYVLSPIISQLLNNPDLCDALKYFSIVPFLMLPTMGLEGILATFKKTKFMTLYILLTRSIMLLFVALPVMIWNLGYLDAIKGFVCASICSFFLALYLKYLPVKNNGDEKCNITCKEILQFAFPLMCASFWAIVINSADQFFISRYLGRETFAEFANGWMEVPFIGMITGACSTVLSPIFSKLSYQKVNPLKEIYPIWINVFEKSIIIIYPILLYCCFFADHIMVFLYGSQYSDSAVYFILRNLSSFFSVIVFAPLLINIGKVALYSNVQLYGAIVLLVLEFISIEIICNPVVIGIISSICTIGRIFILLFYVAKFFNVPIYRLFPMKTILKILFGTILILSCIRYFTLYFFDSAIVIVLISVLLYFILFIIYAKVIKLNIYSLLLPLLKK